MDSQVYKPTSASHPGETVLDYLDSFGWSQRELARRTGITTKTISEICNGKTSVSPSTSLAFEKVLGRPAHFWINLQSKYDEVLARSREAERLATWKNWAKKFPIGELKKRGWIESGDNSTDSDAVNLLRFLGVSSPDSWDSVWGASKVSYRQTRKFKKNDYAISAWARATEHKADEIDTEEYNVDVLIDSLNELRQNTRISLDEGLYRAQSILAKCGVAFVWIPAMPETGISGATRWSGSNRVIVAISLRYKKDDQIWFTLFHELGHVLLHRSKQSFILDNADKNLLDGVVDPDMQKLEDEANRFSADTLIPADLLTKYISFGIFDNDSIFGFAEAIDISPGIVVGRLQHEGLLNPHQGNALKQGIDWSFTED